MGMMDGEVYQGVARLENGEREEKRGTIGECVRWADDLMRDHGGKVSIRIREEEWTPGLAVTQTGGA